MKKFIFIASSFIILSLLNACDSSQPLSEMESSNQPAEIDSSNEDQSEKPRNSDETILNHDQMLSNQLNEIFPLKINQSVKISLENNKNIILTTKKVVEDSRCPGANNGHIVNCVWSGQVVVLLEISKNNEAPTSLQISNLTPATHQDFTITLTKVAPERSVKSKPSSIPDFEPVEIKPTDYTLYFEVKKNS